uniref:non-specific serine/threonine protein kinase n=1 Tax=Davidia involucrata TaxID=16924 RepID=A0A5B7BIW1_DAVIN
MAVSSFLILFFAFTFSEAITNLSEDAMALLSFKSAISHDPSNLLYNWNPSTNHCHWYGVQCDAISGRVIALTITGTHSMGSSRLPELGYNFTLNHSILAGTLPPSIGNLTELQTLSIRHNVFSGEIPAEIGNIRPLQILELQGNNFSGRIPRQIRYLSSLRVLNLSYNSFSGPIPDSLIGFGRANVVDFSNNQLSGGIRVDQCEFLNHLKLSNNFLVGNIPAEIGKCSSLRTLLLDGNILEGRIPPEIGQISELRILDVSRNSLTDRIPREVAKCRKLSVIVLTNLIPYDSSVGEFNAFVGGIPHQVLLLPNLQIFWAPRANLGGRFPGNWNVSSSSSSCSLRVLNLGQNYITGALPENLVMCANLTFLDLSSNGLEGHLPLHLRVPCMVYFNVSRNLLSGVLPRFGNCSCDDHDISMISYGQDIRNQNIPVWGFHMNTLFGSSNLVVVHDFSWNSLTGSLPLFSFGGADGKKTSYKLLLNNNKFNGSLPVELFTNCNDLQSFSVNLGVNQISGVICPELLLHCSRLTDFEAAQNQIGGSIPPEIGSLKMLQQLDFSRNRLSGSLPDQLGELKNLKWFSIGENNLTGEIPAQLGQMTSLVVLDISQNALTGSIPARLANATNLEIVLLDHNRLSGNIPSSFSTLRSLTKLDLSFNNLSGHIPYPRPPSDCDCDCFKGNKFLHSCPDSYSAPPPGGLPVPLQVQKWHSRSKLKSFVIAMTTSASVVLCVLAVIVLVLILGRRKLSRLTSLRRKVVVTFADAPTELNYDNVVRATGNFSIRNLIGTGGFGSTYKAELVPGFLVAVKRLSIGRFQGIQQFDAEIRTLGRIRHKNLVTLIGYYVGEAEMFLIYNYLSGGNLETFIHERAGKNVQWPVICKIAINIAQALAFLHYSCVPRIVHRDIKPSNILLDEELNAYLSDFGLARLLEVSETHATTDVAGTFGYVAPEYATTCRVSDKADVYSFGVVLLELMSGKKSLDPSFSEYGNGFNIVAWAKLLIKEGRSSELFSTELWEAGPKENLLGMLRLASTCTVESLSVRPLMKQVLEKLKQLNS